jgi:hypothetical protein
MLDRRQGALARPRWRVDRWLWERCSATGTFLTFLGLVALALSLSYVLPQAPEHIRMDPIGYQEWLSTVRIEFRNWAVPLEAMGLFQIYETAWFRILLALWIFVLLVTIGKHVGEWIRRRGVRQDDTFFGGPETSVLLSRSPPDQVIGAVRAAMSALFPKVQEQADEGKTYEYGARSAWLSAGVDVLYVGLLLMTLGLAIDGRWGWQQAGVELAPGQSTLIGPDNEGELSLSEPAGNTSGFNISTGTGKSFVLRQDQPVRQDGYRYQLVSQDLPLVGVKAQRADGQMLVLYDYVVQPQPAELLKFPFSSSSSGDETDRLFIVADERVVGRLQWIPDLPGEAQAGFHLWVFREDGQTLVGEQEIAADHTPLTAQIGNMLFTFEISHLVLIDVKYRPGFWSWWIGCALASIGLLGVLMPRLQMWSVVSEQPNGTIVKIYENTQGLAYAYRRQRNKTLAELYQKIRAD